MRRLLSVERHQKILEKVASENAVDFASLADDLGVSSMTIRRDLRILEESGYLKTTRGGASAQLLNTQDILLHPRAADQTLAKTQIGQYAASLIERGEVIFVGPGSTTAIFAQFLPSNFDLTVITPSLAHASLLSSRGIEVISTGGVVRDHLAQTGVIAQETINRYIATRTIMERLTSATDSTNSVRPPLLETPPTPMIERCEEVIVLVDPSKSGVTANYRVAGLDVVDEFVTSSDGVDSLRRQIGAGATILTPNG